MEGCELVVTVIISKSVSYLLYEVPSVLVLTDLLSDKHRNLQFRSSSAAPGKIHFLLTEKCERARVCAGVRVCVCVSVRGERWREREGAKERGRERESELNIKPADKKMSSKCLSSVQTRNI